MAIFICQRLISRLFVTNLCISKACSHFAFLDDIKTLCYTYFVYVTKSNSTLQPHAHFNGCSLNVIFLFATSGKSLLEKLRLLKRRGFIYIIYIWCYFNKEQVRVINVFSYKLPRLCGFLYSLTMRLLCWLPRMLSFVYWLCGVPAPTVWCF